MKTVFVAVFAALAAYVQATTNIQCVEPNVIIRDAIPSAEAKAAEVDLEKLRELIEQRNKEIIAARPEAKILNFEEIKEKYGENLVKKLEDLKKKKKVKVITK
jgi:hypothetical protein